MADRIPRNKIILAYDPHCVLSRLFSDFVGTLGLRARD